MRETEDQTKARVIGALKDTYAEVVARFGAEAVAERGALFRKTGEPGAVAAMLASTRLVEDLDSFAGMLERQSPERFSEEVKVLRWIQDVLIEEAQDLAERTGVEFPAVKVRIARESMGEANTYCLMLAYALELFDDYGKATEAQRCLGA